MGLPCESNNGPPASLSQRLPHKVRKLYSALERLLVSAGPRLVPPKSLILGFPVAPLPISLGFPTLGQFPLACEFGELV